MYREIYCYLLVVMVLLLVFSGWSAADTKNECISKENHEAVTFFLVDRTDKLEDVQNLEQSLLAIEKMIEPA